MRRGFADPAAARALLAADERHRPRRSRASRTAVAAILRHVAAGARITVHGDYDVDGVCSTAILVARAAPRWAPTSTGSCPSRAEDGYGLSRGDRRAARRARARGCWSPSTAAITAVDEVARARAAGIDVVVTDHHRPRADGALPDAPIVHPALGGYPCPDLCAAGVALQARRRAARRRRGGPGAADDDLDLVALATVADCVPLRGREPAARARRACARWPRTRAPGLRALMTRRAASTPRALDARAVGFRLAPRINAAGRLYRADAGLELLLTEDAERARGRSPTSSTASTPSAATSRQRILFEAEAQVAPSRRARRVRARGRGLAPGRHRDRRLADRRAPPPPGRAHRARRRRAAPARAARSRGSTCSRGCDACAEHLLRHGGHRAAAGLRDRARRGRRVPRGVRGPRRGERCSPRTSCPIERVDAVVAGDELGPRARRGARAARAVRHRQPGGLAARPGRALERPAPMGEGKHVRFTRRVRRRCARARSRSARARLPVDGDGPLDATFALELNEWSGAVEPRLVLRCARPCAPAPIEVVGEPADWRRSPARRARRAAAPGPSAARAGARTAPRRGGPRPPRRRDRRHDRRARRIAASRCSSSPPTRSVRARHLRPARRLRAALARGARARPGARRRATPTSSLLDPPARRRHDRGRLGHADVHLAWGPAELRFATPMSESATFVPAHRVYRALRDRAERRARSSRRRSAGDSARCAGRARRRAAREVLAELRRAARPRAARPLIGRTDAPSRGRRSIG